jgi:hypothetical protein
VIGKVTRNFAVLGLLVSHFCPFVPATSQNFLHYAGILELSIAGARNQEGLGLSYRPARLHRLAESIPWAPYFRKHFVFYTTYKPYMLQNKPFRGSNQLDFSGLKNTVKNNM